MSSCEAAFVDNNNKDKGRVVAQRIHTFMWFSPPPWSAKNKNVLITGASAGIGAELAKNFAIQGSSLALLARNKDALMEVAKECRNLGSPSVEVFKCDMTNNSQIKEAICSALKIFGGRLDVIVLNAGRSQGCYFEEIKDVESIDYMLRLNINGVINAIHYSLPSIPKSLNSRIVIISSVAGLIPVPYRTIYCATKHALVGFANALRLELCDTYGGTDDGAPVVQLINFPEVKGTSLNNTRIEFGADIPPMQFKITPSMMSVQEACKQLMKQIENASREWGQPTIIKIIRFIYGFMPNFFDKIITKKVKSSHYRPE